MSDTANIKIGACTVNYKSVDLGHTWGGVTFSYEPEYVDITADQYGNTPVDKALLGEVVTVVARLNESTVVNFSKAIPLSTLTSTTKATFGKDAGARLGTTGGVLILHPIVNGASKADDIILYKAVVSEAVEVEYTNEDERIIEVTFTALVDTTKATGSYLGLIGDSAS